MTKQQTLKGLIRFLESSPTPFHAVREMAETLKKSGFQELSEGDKWRLKKGGAYFLIKGGGSLIAFRLGKNNTPVDGIKIVGGHTDSPALKIKPSPAIVLKDYLKLGVEVYGSPILSTWFDRDLSIAGRVIYTDSSNTNRVALIDFKRPVAIIPNLPIHLAPKGNNKEPLNRQTELPPILMQVDTKKQRGDLVFADLLKAEVKKQVSHQIKEINDADLILYDTQRPVLTGFNKEFICAGKLDNLVSCFSGLQALIDADSRQTTLLVCNDHEEIGSNSQSGAGGPFLKSVLERIMKTREDFYRGISKSVLVSVDNAHGVHPNYPHRFDDNHGPLLNKGPVLKNNANQRYATTAESGSYFRKLCKQAGVPLQEFVGRSDMTCGSTIGPITSTNLGIDTLDIGIPTFAMHSIRETGGCGDISFLYKALVSLFNDPGRYN